MEIKEQVRTVLKDVFTDNSQEGILSIYVYGSITGPDFIEGLSDIDSIALVENRTDQALEKQLIANLKERAPLIQNFGIRLLYVSEFQTLQKKSVLTSFIPPEALLLDF
ncbi:MAG: hypothetical protein JWN18_40, partial [Parcubacteria group bacterium]|nr:hypothetical protein [Parcubacteria group bacterium]